MKPMFYLFLVLLLAIHLPKAAAQPVPVSATLQHNNVKILVQSNGALFWDFSDGQFIAPCQEGQPEISTLRASGLWLGGIDPGGTLTLSAQMYNEGGRADFAAGVYHPQAPDAPPLNKIWRVTREQILAHVADYQDNGVIDAPIPDIFAWPGRSNPYFESYNPGQTLPASGKAFPHHWSNSSNPDYDPSRGDHPLMSIRGLCNQYPHEMLWFTFHNRMPRTQTFSDGIDMQISATVFVFGCEEEDNSLNNTVFIHYRMESQAPETLDSVYVGVFADFDIGNPNDDFIGCNLARRTVFGYNGDAVDDLYGANAPAMAVTLLRGPLDDATFLEAPFGHVSPFGYGNGFNGGPQQAYQYYNLLTGSNTSGTPIGSLYSNYPGDPNDPNADSEIAAGNTPGDRRAVSSFGPFRMDPGTVNELIVSYSFTQLPDATPLENVAAMYHQVDEIYDYYYQCFKTVNQHCTPLISSFVEPMDTKSGLTLMPNPASHEVRIQSPDNAIQRLDVYDATGKRIQALFRETGLSAWTLSLDWFSPGIYWIKAQRDDGSWTARPLVVIR